MKPTILISKLSMLDELKSGENALDIGFGNGKDSIFLNDKGYEVDALDIKGNDGLEDDINVIESKIEDYDIEEGKYHVINANNTFPFVSDKEEVKRIIKDSVSGLKDGGFLCFSLFGTKDAWIDRENISFWDYDETLSFISELPVKIYFKENEEGYGLTMKGEKKWWNIYRFILKK
jgi:SAM-dependent methyltransferase